ncbi:MAG: hypothetical protein HOV96_41645 [Nonomuraea sp.]|nr:hypothetical protein [Streptomyces sp.]NUP84052.1 hypothetical protein [Nonomuraea sp.]
MRRKTDLVAALVAGALLLTDSVPAAAITASKPTAHGPGPGADSPDTAGSLDNDVVAGIAAEPNALPLLDAPLLRKILEGLRRPHAPAGVGVRIIPGRLRRGSDYLMRVHCPTNANAAQLISSVFNVVGQRRHRMTVFGLPYLIHGTGHGPSPLPLSRDLAVGVYPVYLRCLRVTSNPLSWSNKRHREVVARAMTTVIVRPFRLNRF